MNATLQEQIAPEIVRAIVAQATARGISVNDYLRQVLGLNGQPQELALAAGNGTAVTREERPFYETASIDEWISEFTKWADSHDSNAPSLPLEAVSRESIYSDID